MRLNAYLARAGIASRRASDDLIKAGRVKVNDVPGALNTYVHTGEDEARAARDKMRAAMRGKA